MEKKKKVVVIDNSISVTGAFVSVLNIILQLSDKVDFMVGVPDKSGVIPVLNENKVFYYTFKFIELSKSIKTALYLPQLLLNSFKIVRLIRKHKVDILHINDLYNMTGVVTKILYPKVKLVYHIRLLPSSYIGSFFNLWVGIICKYADQIVCVSNAVMQQLPSAKNITVIYDSLSDHEKYANIIDSENNDIINIIYLGNLIQGKGQDIGLQAFKKAYKDNKNIRIKFVGGGISDTNLFYNKLKAEVHSEGLENVVTFQGFCTDVEKVIKEANIVLNLSESESFSMVCLESLWYGTPLIASDCGGPAELFENSISGILVPNKNAEAAAIAIIELSNNPELRNKFSINGRKYVKEKFKIETTINKIYELYNT